MAVKTERERTKREVMQFIFSFHHVSVRDNSKQTTNLGFSGFWNMEDCCDESGLGVLEASSTIMACFSDLTGPRRAEGCYWTSFV